MQLVREIKKGKMIKDASDVYYYLREFGDEDREFFVVIGLDTKNKPCYREVVHVGTLNSCIVHPREVFKKAIMMSCDSIIVAHNHPSGDSEPSKEDVTICKRLSLAGELLGIKVLDALIVTSSDYRSLLDELKEAKI